MGEIFTPNADQLSGLDFIMQKSYGALFWDPGTRKTSTILFGYKLLRDAGLINRLLVLSSVNVVDDVWPAEMERWDELNVTYAPIRGSRKRRIEGFELEADVYLCNMENIEWLQKKFAARSKQLKIDMLYVDESDNFRNRGTHRFRALKKTLPQFKRRYIGTGSPTPKGYKNLWAQMFIVDRGQTLGPDLGAYMIEFFRPGGFKGKEWILRDGAEFEIQKRIADRVHRVEKHMDVSISFEDVVVELPTKARKFYDEMEQECISEMNRRVVVAGNAAIATGKLRQAANGAVYYDREHNWTEVHREKVEALKKIVRGLKGDPVLVAYEFDHDYEMLQKCGVKFPSYTVAKKGQRGELLRAWNNGELKILGGNIAGMSAGLNAQFGGHHLVYYGMTFSLRDYEQFFQRLWRDGQKNDVQAWRIVAGDTVDDVMMDTVHQRDYDQKTFLAAFERRYGR